LAKDEEAKDDADASAGGKKKLIIMIVPIVLLLAGAGWYLFLRPDKSGAPEALPEPTPGAVVQLEPITVNLAGGHFLKLGMAIQPTASAKEVNGAKVLDLAIGEFSQMTIDELSSSEGRQKAKEELVARIKLSYVPEGTDLATVTSSDPAPKETGKSSEGSSKSTTEPEPIDIEKLSAAQAIKLADSLTVQAEVYDVYFTDFVMQ
jgi:flagellar FliL protein